MKIITMKAFNRPERLQEALQSLQACRGVQDYLLYLSIDYGALQSVLSNVAKQYPHNIVVDLAKHPMGCAGNTRQCLSAAFDQLSATDWVIHMEDDMLASKDALTFIEVAGKKATELRTSGQDIFAVCTFNRMSFIKEYRTNHPSEHLLGRSLDTGFTRKWFDMGGLWAIDAHTYNRIKELGGVFGAFESHRVPHGVYGKEYLSMIQQHDAGSWGWPFNLYFREGRPCLYPHVSRSQNTGDDPPGVSTFNPGPMYHVNNIHDPTWLPAHNPEHITLLDTFEIHGTVGEPLARE